MFWCNKKAKQLEIEILALKQRNKREDDKKAAAIYEAAFKDLKCPKCGAKAQIHRFPSNSFMTMESIKICDKGHKFNRDWFFEGKKVMARIEYEIGEI